MILKQILPFAIFVAYIFLPNAIQGQVQLQPGQSFIVVEEMPYFPGCEGTSNKEKRNCSKQALAKFLADSITPLATNQHDSLELSVQFIVEPDGCISEVKLNNGDAIYEESIKTAMEAMPKWMPGKQRGLVTRVMYRMPLKIGLD